MQIIVGPLLPPPPRRRSVHLSLARAWPEEALGAASGAAGTARARRPRRGRGSSGSGAAAAAGGAGGGTDCCPAAACRRLLRLCNHRFTKRSSPGGVGIGLRSALSKVLGSRAMRRVLRWDDLGGAAAAASPAPAPAAPASSAACVAAASGTAASARR